MAGELADALADGQEPMPDGSVQDATDSPYDAGGDAVPE
jgi:hypothetical protein